MHQKPLPLLEAQVAVYAASHSQAQYPKRQAILLDSLGQVALCRNEVPGSTTYPRPGDKKEWIERKLVVTQPQGTPLPLFDNDEYLAFLRDKNNREEIRSLATLIANYPKMAASVDALGVHGLNYIQAREHPSLIGRGTTKSGYEFMAELDGETKNLVALVPHPLYREGPDVRILIHERAASLALVKGLSGFEQGVAVSYDPPVIVAEKVLGKAWDELSSEERASIPEEHWNAFISNIRVGSELGIELDTDDSNLFHDPNVGFTVIDFHKGSPGKQSTTMGKNLEYITGLHQT